jgi:uncharacterized damage-inducible protein DinB
VEPERYGRSSARDVLEPAPYAHSVSDPIIEAARKILDRSLEAMRAAVVGATAEDLARRPAGEDTNPIVVIVVHAMHSTRWWLSVASGAHMPDRDRPSEFAATTENADDLLTLLDQFGDECRDLLSGATAFDPAATWKAPDGEPVTRAWALLHALEHLREHVAQASLTRQMVSEQ